MPGHHHITPAVTDAIRQFVARHRQPARGAGVVLAVSGGADSIALLRGMHAVAADFGWQLHVAHLDHGLRAEAAADAAFVREVSAAFGLPVTTATADVRALAARTGMSIEMAAREARYTMLADVAAAQGASGILTAHTADDQAETVLLRMARGCGLAGLRGIPPIGAHRGIPVLRPLLTLSRKAIEGDLRAIGQAWREDASNRDPTHLRNRVRGTVLPLLAAELNPGVKQSLCRLASLAAEDEALLATLVDEQMPTCEAEDGGLAVIPLRDQPLPIRRRLILRWLFAHGVSAEAVTAERIDAVVRLCRTTDGSRSIAMGSGLTVCREYDRLLLRTEPADSQPLEPVPLAIRGVTHLPPLGLQVHITREAGIRKDSGAIIGVYPRFASLRGDLPLPLMVRAPRPGDRIKPLGMTGSRKLQDILVDAHVPSADRSHIPVFEAGGEIVWIPGYRVARTAAVADVNIESLQIIVMPRDHGQATNGDAHPQSGLPSPMYPARFSRRAQLPGYVIKP